MRKVEVVGILIGVVLITTGILALIRPTVLVGAHLTWGSGLAYDFRS
jgi:hypothetical protein